MWLDALGRRLPEPYLPGYDTLGTLRYLRTTPDIADYDHSWSILTQKIIEKEFALSGSEQNPDITSKDRFAFLRERLLSKEAAGPVEAFKEHGADFVIADTLEQLVEKMNGLTDQRLLDAAGIGAQIQARDLQMDNPTARTPRSRASATPAATSPTDSEYHTPTTPPVAQSGCGPLDYRTPVRTCWHRPSSSHHGSQTGCPGVWGRGHESGGDVDRSDSGWIQWRKRLGLVRSAAGLRAAEPFAGILHLWLRA
jgi:hypothetical protein